MLTDRLKFDAALLLAGAALWMAVHPYAGIYQDANLYLLMALNWLAPDAYARDPWFLFGSQDSYSFFSPIYGSLLRFVGISDGARTLVLLGGALWLGASWLAVRRVFSDPLPRAVAFLCCAVFSTNISPAGSTFVLNENFATARLLAVPLGVAAVAGGLRRQSIAPWGLGFCALALHPLFGIWPLLFLIAYRLPDRLLAMAIPFGLLLPFLLAAGSAVPMIAPLSPERWAFLQETTRDLLVMGGDVMRLNPLLFWLAALLIGGRWGHEAFRRAYLIIALIAGAAYLLSALVSNYQPLTILIQAQPWRAVWLAAYFSVFALVDVAWRLGRADSMGWYRVALIAAVLIVCRPAAGFLLLAAWGICRVAGMMAWTADWRPLSAGTMRIAAVAAVLLALPGYVADVRLEGEALTHFGWDIEHTLRGIVGGGGLGLGPVLVSCALIGLLSRPRLVFPILFALLAWVGGNWDTRDFSARHWEESFQAGQVSPFTGFRRGQTVHWPGRLPDVWFGLGTAAYVGEYHLSGLVFSEQRVELVARRWKRVAVSSVIDDSASGAGGEERALGEFRQRYPERDYSRGHPGDYVAKELTPAGLVYLCVDPALDWVIAKWPEVSGVAGAAVSGLASGASHLYAYPCATFRAQRGTLDGKVITLLRSEAPQADGAST